MKIWVNGELVDVALQTTVLQWLNEQKVVPESAIIELNEAILSQDRWESTVLQNGDRLELFLFVGGG
ncbi:MAG: sulfur carrier protein ThiS [Desulfitobacteriaceae bacterium]|nr:sulfur carrier protein ThiS [Desulfitobacteriaceae bacterium]MDI6913398.1 sulfur carrier protein ThiS [Desulfitobacteriaceae bacterium]